MFLLDPFICPILGATEFQSQSGLYLICIVNESCKIFFF